MSLLFSSFCSFLLAFPFYETVLQPKNLFFPSIHANLLKEGISFLTCVFFVQQFGKRFLTTKGQPSITASAVNPRKGPETGMPLCHLPVTHPGALQQTHPACDSFMLAKKQRYFIPYTILLSPKISLQKNVFHHLVTFLSFHRLAPMELLRETQIVLTHVSKDRQSVPIPRAG